jgi:multidrug efflux pump subunit AcrA (membrane-fusion protein)
VSARIRTGTRRVPTVPRDAVVSFAGIAKVLTVQDGKALEVPVTVGDSSGDRVEIVSGLEPGQAVVRRPGSLQQGQPVQLASSAPAAGQ